MTEANQRIGQLIRAVASAYVDHPHALQLAPGDNVKTRAAVCQQLKNGQRGVGLHRITDQVIAATQRLLKKLEPFRNLVGGVDVERRAVAAGKRLKRDLGAMQCTAGAGVVKGAG